MKKYVSPTGSEIIGALESVPAIVGITGINLETGEPEYDGNGSRLDWDAQKSVMIGDKRAYVDEDGTAWPYHVIREVEDSEEDDDA